MKKIIYTFATAAVVSALTSCEKYLDIKPYDKVIPETAEDFSALLHNHLNDIDQGSDSYIVPDFSSNSNFDACYSDEFEICLTQKGGSRLSNYLGDFLTYGRYDEYYRGLYAVIRDCNIILHEMKEEGTEEANKVRATAYAMRGVAYYHLLRYFCQIPQPGAYESQLGVPVVTYFDMEATPARSSLQTTMMQAETDLLTSLTYNMTDPIFLFTPDVVKGYLARLYFWCRRWDDCLGMSQKLLAAHPLLDRDGFKAMMENEYKLTGNELIKAYRSLSASGSASMSGILSSLQYRPVSLRYISNYPVDERTADVRYFMSVNTKRQAKKPVFCGMRGAEFKLMEAECLYHLGRKSEALASVNDLRRNRITDYEDIKMESLPELNDMELIKVDVNGQPLTKLLGLILRERRKELFMEGDRFFELKRNGAPEFVTFYNGVKYKTESYMYTFPIPIREFDIVSNMIQNPGYTEIVNRY